MRKTKIILWWRNSSWVGCVFWKCQKQEFWNFDFLHVGLKVDAARYRCRMNVVESALERVSIRVYNHKMFCNKDGWNFLSGQKFRCVWSEKLEILLFQNVEFCFHETCLGLDLRRYACAMDMVDSAFERIDVGLFKPGIDYNVGGTFIALHQKLIWSNSSPIWILEIFS